MSPRAPFRLLTIILLIAALADLAASMIGMEKILWILAALAAGSLLALWLRATRPAPAMGDPRLRSTSSPAAHPSTYSRSRFVYPGIEGQFAPAQPARRLHRIAAAVTAAAVMSTVVAGIVALRTIVALEMLH
jgi:hypothetical protein